MAAPSLVKPKEDEPPIASGWAARPSGDTFENEDPENSSHRCRPGPALNRSRQGDAAGQTYHRPSGSPSWSGETAPIDTNRLALVIGNATYPDADSPLSQMGRDAYALANALRKDSFRVGTVYNATRKDMTRAIDHLRPRAHSNSIVLVYFGGFGIQSGGANYLIPVHAKIWNERDVRRQGVRVDSLLSKLNDSGAQVLLVIEASHRNPYERRFRTYSHGLAPIHPTRNSLILSSAAPGQVVERSEEPDSRLMTALLAELNSSRGIEETFRTAQNAVATATQDQQIPAVSSTLTEIVSLSAARSGDPVFSVGAGDMARWIFVLIPRLTLWSASGLFWISAGDLRAKGGHR